MVTSVERLTNHSSFYCMHSGVTKRSSLPRCSQQQGTRSPPGIRQGSDGKMTEDTSMGGREGRGFAFFLLYFLFFFLYSHTLFLCIIKQAKTLQGPWPWGLGAGAAPHTHHGDTDGVLVLLREDAHQGGGQEQQDQGVLKLQREHRAAGWWGWVLLFLLRAGLPGQHYRDPRAREEDRPLQRFST